MANNLFVASTSRASGKSVICIGLISALRGLVSNIGYFKPVGQKYKKGEKYDKEAIMLKELFDLEDEIAVINPVSFEELNNIITNKEHQKFFKKIQTSYEKIQRDKDIVFIDGTDYLGKMTSYEFDINIGIANNLNASMILVEDGNNRAIEDIVSSVIAAKNSLDEENCNFLGVIVNKVEPEEHPEIDEKLRISFRSQNIDYFGSVPFNSILPKPRMIDIARSLGATVLFGQEHLSNIAVSTLIASMSFENALKYIKNGDLIIVGGDRSEILLGAMTSYLSPSFPNISGIVLTGDLQPNDNIKKLVGSLTEVSIPILSVQNHTLETANMIENLTVHVDSKDMEKIDIAKSLIYSHISFREINTRLGMPTVKKRTPEIVKYELIEKARVNKQRIVLPEGDEERTLRAVGKIRAMDISDIILLGDPDLIQNRAKSLDVALDSGVEIIDPIKSGTFIDYSATFLELRRHKHFTIEIANDRMQDPIYYGTMMVYKGDADGLVSGAVHTTRHTIRPAFEIIKTKADISIASSVFLMCLKDRALVYGDCAIVPNPNAQELADIAITSAETARFFDIEPYVAMLSYSTGESGVGPEVEKVREAAEIARNKRPDLEIEGPIQYDAAIDPHVAKIKLPESAVAGKATVFIFPDLNTGNNTYKAVQRAARAIAMGPIVQGLNKPVNDLSRGCLVEDIVYTVAITAIQAQAEKEGT